MRKFYFVRSYGITGVIDEQDMNQLANDSKRIRLKLEILDILHFHCLANAYRFAKRYYDETEEIEEGVYRFTTEVLVKALQSEEESSRELVKLLRKAERK